MKKKIKEFRKRHGMKKLSIKLSKVKEILKRVLDCCKE